MESITSHTTLEPDALGEVVFVAPSDTSQFRASRLEVFAEDLVTHEPVHVLCGRIHIGDCPGMEMRPLASSEALGEGNDEPFLAYIGTREQRGELHMAVQNPTRNRVRITARVLGGSSP